MRPPAPRGALAACLCGAAVALAVPCPGTAAPAVAAGSYSFCVVPQFEQRKLFAIWNPIVQELSRRTGIELRLETTLGVPEYEQGVRTGRFDLVYANPYHVYRERHGQGYVPILRDDVPLRGIVVVARDSPIRSVKDLDGRTLAVPSPNAIGASLLVRADLLRQHGVRVQIVNAKTHSSAYLHVATGTTAAGGGVDKTLREQPADVQNALRVLYVTREFASHPVAVHPRVPAETRLRIQRALLELAATPEGAALLERVPMIHPVAARMADYGPFGALRLEEFWEGP
jgi:phosphonate transport system substrate-binding protein